MEEFACLCYHIKFSSKDDENYTSNFQSGRGVRNIRRVLNEKMVLRIG